MVVTKIGHNAMAQDTLALIVLRWLTGEPSLGSRAGALNKHEYIVTGPNQEVAA
jgi:hypothetical protein